MNGHALAREGLTALVSARPPDHWQVVYAGGDPGEAVRAKPDVVVLNLDDVPPGSPTPESMAVFDGLPVVVTSSAMEPDAIRRALMSGALGHVSRHQSYEDLHRAMSSAVRGIPHMSPDLGEIMAGASAVPTLSPREVAALRLYVGGLRMEEVAKALSVSTHTAREYIDRVREKYAKRGRTVRTRTELYAAALRDGFLATQE